MRLNEHELKILVGAHLDADLPADELARKLKTKPHVVHYTLSKLKSSGAIQKWPIINFFACGLEQHNVYFSLSNHSKRREIISFLSHHPFVIWFGELGGDLNYGVTLLAKNADHASKFLDDFVMRFGSCFEQLKTAAVLELKFLRKNYLSSGSKRNDSDSVTIGVSPKTQFLDPTDWRIVQALHKSEISSNREIATALKIPRSTIDKRILKLRERGILVRNVFLIRAATLNFQIHKVLLRTRGPNPELRKKLISFVLGEPSVVNFFRCFGSWEYELVLETPGGRDVVDFRERIFGAFGAALLSVEILPIFSQTTSKRFLDDSTDFTA